MDWKPIVRIKLICTKRVNYTNTALELFNYFTKTIHNKKIEQIEGNIIQKSSIGSILFYKPYSVTVYKYDMISTYPSILMSNLLRP